ncbi:MAG: Rieske (2Fe-2S) protein [Planctomycetota bacterium]
MSNFETVAKVGDISPGQGKAVEFNDRLVAIFNENGVFRAIDDMCPHMGASLAAGHFEDGIVTCPWHAWSFDTTDGTWCQNRRLKIDIFDVRVVGDEIQLAVPEDDATANDSRSLENDAGPDQPGDANE